MTYGQITSMIAGYRQSKHSITKIANEFGNKSTICREVKRNTGERGYRSEQANDKAFLRKTLSLKAIK